jgi:hypothetical protein
VFPLLAPKVRVPVRFRVAEHERWWEADETTFAEMRAAFTSSPNVDLGVQPSAGHNISLGWAARAWHLGAIAFAEQALLSRPQRRLQLSSAVQANRMTNAGGKPVS